MYRRLFVSLFVILSLALTSCSGPKTNSSATTSPDTLSRNHSVEPTTQPPEPESAAPTPVAPPTEQQAPAPQTPADAGTVAGIVMWPDKTPAVNTTVVFYPQGFSLSLGTPTVEGVLGQDGAYYITDCPCHPLVGWIHVPSVSNRGPWDGGRDCNIPLIPLIPQGTIGGVIVNRGGRLDWVVLNAPCSWNPYSLKPQDAAQQIAALRSEQAAVLANPNDYSIPDQGYAGTWQDARTRVSR
ncbi:hypothetical protein SAMN04487914_13946 [Arthrobacter sp. ok909]|nr:hypothetical protein SAMN04487914_13946 [Arthrobacter sp. ok909]